MDNHQFPPLPAAWEGRKIIGVLGHGSYGTVYELESEDGRHSALKILVGQDKGPSRSVQAAIGKCPYLTDIKEYVCEHGLTYLLMDLLTPFTEKLSELMDASFHAENEADYSVPEKHLEGILIDWMIDLAKAISFMEQNQLLHRDIKPENLLIDKDNRCLLGDLDQTRLLTGSTATLSVQGTFQFMAPEVYHGKSYDSRADLYSLGLVFYWCCNRQQGPFLDEKKRFHDQSDYEQALRLRMEGAKLPELTAVSGEFSDIILTLCQFDPDKRYQDAEALLSDLEKVKAGKYHRKKVLNKKAVKRSLSDSTKEKVLLHKGSGFRYFIPLCIILVLTLLGGGMYYYQNFRVIETRKWGTDGDVLFTLNASGKATFSGSGIVTPYEVPEDWDQLSLKIKSLLVEGGIPEFGLCFTMSPVLECITLEKGVKKLTGFSQFSTCRMLKELNLPDGLESMEAQAFSLCASLESIYLPDSIHVIPDACFVDCSMLSEIISNWEFSEIGDLAFSGTAWLEKKQAEEGFVVVNGILLAAPQDLEELEIPSELGISSLTSGLFAVNTQIKKVVLPEGIAKIGSSCFAACKNLKEIVLPSSLRVIETGAFQNCSSLVEIEIGNQVDITAGDIFTDSAYLDLITDSDGFATLNGVLLAYRGSADEVEIPNGIHTIANSAFRTNQMIRKVMIPDSVRYICSAAFLMCTNLTDITVSEDVEIADQSSFGGVPGWNR